MMFAQRQPLFSLCIALACSVGCGTEGTAPVSGIATLDGEPVYPARVNFAPKAADGAVQAAGRLSTAMTEPDGSYTIDAAALGKNTVGVMMMPADEDSEEAEDNEQPLPVGKLSQSVYTVVDGDNNIDLNMTAIKTESKGRGRGRMMEEDD